MFNKRHGLIVILILAWSCSGISHRYVPNWNTVNIPEKPGKYPKVTESDLLRGELSKFKSCYDVTFYDLDIDVDIDNKSISGWVDFHVNSITTLDTLQFDLSDKLKIVSITFMKNNIPFYRKLNSVFAVFPQTEKGSQMVFRVTYEGKPVEAKNAPWDGGFEWTEDKNDNPWVAVACEGEGALLWWPNKDHPTEEPDSMQITIHAPSDLFAVANGTLEEVRNSSSDGKMAYRWMVRNPINNYNVTLNIGDYVLVADTLINQSGIHQMDHYVLSYNQAVAQSHFKQARDVIHVFEKYFGEFPWWNDGYRLVETPYRGMEHQSAVAYGNEYKNNNNYYIYDLVDYIILHESAHEWWGNNISACDGADIWLHEAFATYSEVIYLEEKLGKLVSVDYLMNKRRYIRNSLPMVGPRDVNYWGFDDVYWKGAWVLHTLRSVINDDDTFYGILYEFQTRFAKSIVCTEDFINLVNEMTHTDYTYFFDQYLYDRKPPIFEYKITDTNLEYRWTDVPNSFIMPLYISVNEEQIWLQPTTEFQTFNLPLHSTVDIPDRYFYMAVKE